MWENNTITPVERPDVFGNKELLTDEDMAFIQQRIGEIMAAGEDALFGGGVLEAVFSGEINSYDPTTGNYDSQWMAERTAPLYRRSQTLPTANILRRLKRRLLPPGNGRMARGPSGRLWI